MEFLGDCPTCAKQLELKQINFDTAVFICPDIKCPYPTQGECLVVNRNIEDINTPVDVCTLLRKHLEILEESSDNTSNGNDNSTESFMQDLDELFNSQVMDEMEKTIQEPEVDPIELLQNSNTEPNVQSDNQLDVSDLDDFLTNLLN